MLITRLNVFKSISGTPFWLTLIAINSTHKLVILLTPFCISWFHLATGDEFNSFLYTSGIKRSKNRLQFSSVSAWPLIKFFKKINKIIKF